MAIKTFVVKIDMSNHEANVVLRALAAYDDADEKGMATWVANRILDALKAGREAA